MLIGRIAMVFILSTNEWIKNDQILMEIKYKILMKRRLSNILFCKFYKENWEYTNKK